MMKKHTLLLTVMLALSPLGARAGEPIEPPVPVRTVAPEYPPEMRRDGTAGLVLINCLVDEKGTVQDPKVEKTSNEAFSQPALDALSKWRFKPAKKAGAAIAIRVSIPIKFTVGD